MEIDFAKLWERDKTNKKSQQQFWDGRAEEFNSKISESKTIKQTKEVINYLEKKGVLEKDCSVLDIGCGPGKYTMAFAKKVKAVTGTDISSKMLTLAKGNAKNSGLDNTRFVQSSWAKANLSTMGWEQNFDLVFASFCPGIDGPKALKKLVKASCKHCFISSFVTRKDRVLDGLKDRLGIKKTPWGIQTYYSFNLLWNWGYYPEIIYHDRTWSNDYDIDQMADNFLARLDERIYFNRGDIVDYLKEFSVDGKIKEQTVSKVAWIYWQV